MMFALLLATASLFASQSASAAAVRALKQQAASPDLSKTYLTDNRGLRPNITGFDFIGDNRWFNGNDIPGQHVSVCV